MSQTEMMDDYRIVTGYVYGVRCWDISLHWDLDNNRPKATGLKSVVQEFTWSLNGPTTSNCMFHDHKSPELKCSCGLYAMSIIDCVIRTVRPCCLRLIGNVRRGALHYYDGTAVGLVRMHGKVIVHHKDNVFRAEAAEPLVVVVPPQFEQHMLDSFKGKVVSLHDIEVSGLELLECYAETANLQRLPRVRELRFHHT